MKKESLLQAMGHIDPALISGAAPDITRKKSKDKIWIRWSFAAACLCLVIAAAFRLAVSFSGTQGTDPNWSKTHYETTSFEKISAVCGTEIFRILPLEEGLKYHYVLTVREGGDFANPADWKTLSVVPMRAGNRGSSASFDISLDGASAVSLHPQAFENSQTAEIGGVTVEYREWRKNEPSSSGKAFQTSCEYKVYARFSYGDYTYCVETESDDPDFYENTIRRMLDGAEVS